MRVEGWRTSLPCSQCPLRGSKSFAEISDLELNAIQSFKTDHLRLSAGRSILKAAGNTAEFYTLRSGWAIRYKLVDDTRQILNFLLPGDLIAFQAVFGMRPHYAVQALTEVELCAFSAAGLSAFSSQDPRLGQELGRLAAWEAQLLDVHLTCLGRRSADARMAALFHELFERLRVRRMTQGNTCTIPVTQDHLADALGLSAVHVNRTLKKLTADGLVRFERGTLTVLDMAGLRDLSGLNGDLPNGAAPFLL